jgi:hypothetical protein
VRTLKHDIVSENFNLIARHTYCTYQFGADELAEMPRTLARQSAYLPFGLHLHP